MGCVHGKSHPLLKILNFRPIFSMNIFFYMFQNFENAKKLSNYQVMNDLINAIKIATHKFSPFLLLHSIQCGTNFLVRLQVVTALAGD